MNVKFRIRLITIVVLQYLYCSKWIIIGVNQIDRGSHSSEIVLRRMNRAVSFHVSVRTVIEVQEGFPCLVHRSTVRRSLKKIINKISQST